MTHTDKKIPSKPGALKVVTIILTLVCCVGALMLLIPMPTNWLWLLAAGINECTLWLLFAASIGVVVGLFAGIKAQWKPAYVCVALCASVIVYVTALTMQVFDVTREYQSHLSFRDYICGEHESKAPITIIKDIPVRIAQSESLEIDAYTGGSRATLAPIVVVLHGGSWRRGHKSDFAQFDRWLVQNGYAVFDISYRYAKPGCEFPAQLSDVLETLKWIYNNGDKYGADKNRMAVLGRSAGAQLALEAAYNAALTPDSAPNWNEKLPKINRETIRCVISYYAPTNLSWDYYHPCFPDIVDTHGTLENYLAGPPDKEGSRYSAASPAEQVSRECPPTLILQGGRDQVVRKENASQLIDRLINAKVPYTYVYLPWANHGFDFRFSGWSSQISRPVVLKFLNKYLK